MHHAVPIMRTHKCINIPAQNFGCYFFEKEIPIAECGFSFPFDTFVYAYWITSETITKIDYIYNPNDYVLAGKLTINETIVLSVV